MTFWLKVQMLYHMSYRGLVGVKATKLGSSDKHPASLRAWAGCLQNKDLRPKT